MIRPPEYTHEYGTNLLSLNTPVDTSTNKNLMGGFSSPFWPIVYPRGTMFNTKPKGYNNNPGIRLIYDENRRIQAVYPAMERRYQPDGSDRLTPNYYGRSVDQFDISTHSFIRPQDIDVSRKLF
jgi:hypothetical protein